MQLTQLPDESLDEFLQRLEATATKDFESQTSPLATGYASGIACNGTEILACNVTEIKAAHQQQARNRHRARQTRWYVNDAVVAKKDISMEVSTYDKKISVVKNINPSETIEKLRNLIDANYGGGYTSEEDYEAMSTLLENVTTLDCEKCSATIFDSQSDLDKSGNLIVCPDCKEKEASNA